MAADQQKLTRDNTMQATAKEGIKFLEKADPGLAEECKTVTKEAAENGAGDAPEVAENGDTNGEKPKMTRDNTMVTTAQEGQEFLEKQGGVNADAKTRAQDAELNKSVDEDKENGEEDKQAQKRPAEDNETEEIKKQKTGDDVEEAKEETAQEEQTAE